MSGAAASNAAPINETHVCATCRIANASRRSGLRKTFGHGWKYRGPVQSSFQNSQSLAETHERHARIGSVLHFWGVEAILEIRAQVIQHPFVEGPLGNDLQQALDARVNAVSERPPVVVHEAVVAPVDPPGDLQPFFDPLLGGHCHCAAVRQHAPEPVTGPTQDVVHHLPVANAMFRRETTRIEGGGAILSATSHNNLRSFCIFIALKNPNKTKQQLLYRTCS